MAAGFPLKINEKHIRTSEALYQACRFPHLPNVQMKIIDQRSPMTAKMASKKHIDESRSDWMEIRTMVMEWCLRVKLAQNFETFGDLLRNTDDRPIIEKTFRVNDFWAANQHGDKLVGVNMLGKLLMKLRDEIHEWNEFTEVRPLELDNFKLLDEDIGTVSVVRENLTTEWFE